MTLLKRVWRSMTEDRLTIVAAGVAFYLFLSLFPLLFAGISMYGLVADAGQVDQHLDRLSTHMPPSALEILRGQVEDVARSDDKGLGWGVALAVGLALFSAGRGARAMIKGLNIAYDATEDRGFLKRYAVSFLLTVGFLLFIALTLALITAVPALIKELPLGVVAEYGAFAAKWTLLLLLVLAALALVYRYAPCHHSTRWTITGKGSLAAAVLWLLASAGFSWFAASFGKFNETYGVLAGAVVLLLWLQISSLVVLAGAELNNQFEEM